MTARRFRSADIERDLAFEIGGDQVIPTGYDQLPIFLRATLENVRLGEIVQSIDFGGSPGVVTTGKGTYSADYRAVRGCPWACCKPAW